MALASIAANERQYSLLRERFHEDWNARLIFRDIERINSKFYPVPIEGLRESEIEGGPDVIEEYDSGFLRMKDAVSLYEKCSEVLHAENPFRTPKAYDKVLDQLREKLPLFKTLLGNFWVYLVPPEKAFCVCFYFGQRKDINVALFHFGGEEDAGRRASPI